LGGGSVIRIEDGRDNAVELAAAIAFKRRGAETKLVLPGPAQQNDRSRCDPALIKAIARGARWFEELATATPDPCRSWPNVMA